MKPMQKLRNRTVAGVAIALLAASGLAIAQNPAQNPAQPADQPNFDKPLQSGQAVRSGGVSGGGRSASQISITSMEDGERFEVSIRDGQISAKHNGRDVPADRIRKTESGVEILDSRGEVLKSFEVSMAPGLAPPAPPAPPAARGGTLRPAPRDMQRFPNSDVPAVAPAPRVMIGITMVPVPEALTEHLELEAGEAISVDRVLEGLPAERAGLRAGDIIIEVAGKRPVTETSIREQIGKLDPGDKLELKVLRRGREETLTITVDRFSPESFARTAPEGGGMEKGNIEEAEKRILEAERLMRDRLQEMEGIRGIDPAILERFQARGLGGVGPRGFELFVPAKPAEQSKMRDHLTQLDERMADLERQMEGLAERMDELLTSIERREQRRNRE